MSDQDEPVRLKRHAKGKRPQYFADPATDKLLKMVLTLSQELSVALERIDTLECLLSAHSNVSRDEIESFKPDEATKARRDASRAQMIERLFQPSRAEYDALTEKDASNTKSGGKPQ